MTCHEKFYGLFMQTTLAHIAKSSSCYVHFPSTVKVPRISLACLDKRCFVELHCMGVVHLREPEVSKQNHLQYFLFLQDLSN